MPIVCQFLFYFIPVSSHGFSSLHKFWRYNVVLPILFNQISQILQIKGNNAG